MTIIYNTNFTHNPNAYLTFGVQRAAEALFGRDNVVVADNRDLVELAGGGEHDVLICLDGQRLSRPLLERVRPAIATTILWLFEDPFMLDYNKANADLFDYVFTNDPACAASYGKKGFYLPLAGSTSLHRREIRADPTLEYDIFFAGTMWPNRVTVLREVLKNFSDKRIKLVCPTNIFLPPLPQDIASRAIQWPVSHESFIDFANASRVTLTMFRDYASHGDVGKATAPGPRLFELGLAGTAQVLEVDPGLRVEPFKVVDGVACCDRIATLVAEIRGLLDDPAKRHARAEAAQASVLEKHTYEHRLRSIVASTKGDFSKRSATPAMQAPASSDAAVRCLRVLMCTHSTMHQPEWGGVEVYQQILVSALSAQVEVFFWLRRGDSCTLMDSNGTVLEKLSAPEISWLDSLNDAREETAFSTVISQYGFDIVHFQHLGHHTASLPIIAKSCGAATVFSVHDFFLICSRYNLLDYNSRYCDIGNRSIVACDICLQVAEQVKPGGQATRRNFMAEMLRSVDMLLFGTAYSAQLTQRIYPDIADKQRLVLGIPTSTNVAAALPRALRNPETPLKIAVIGNFLRTKGADTILRIIETVNPSLFEFYLFGKAEAAFDAVLQTQNYPHVQYFGRYMPGELDALDGCDIALHLSIWPETFCISLSEAWQHGLVPIVTDTGALKDRVVHGETGFVVNIDDAAAVVTYMELLRADPAMLQAMRARVTPALWVNPGDYATRMLDAYRSILPRRSLGTTSLGFDIGQLHFLPHGSWRDLAPPRHIFDPEFRTDIGLDFPAEIDTWLEVDGMVAWVDSVCGIPVEQPSPAPFRPASDLTFTGWAFVPGIGLAGRLFVAMVGQDGAPTLFLEAQRTVNSSISDKLPGAPEQVGFTTSRPLHGKWSDGRYDIATINVFDRRAAFIPAGIGIQLRDAQVIDVWVTASPSARSLLVDATAGHALEQVASSLGEKSWFLETALFESNMPFKHATYHETDFRPLPGHAIWGPYISLPVGRFRAHYSLRLSGSWLGLRKVRITLDVTRGGSDIVATRRLQADDLRGLAERSVEVEFSNADATARYEFRIHVAGSATYQAQLRFSGVRIEQVETDGAWGGTAPAAATALRAAAGLAGAHAKSR